MRWPSKSGTIARVQKFRRDRAVAEVVKIGESIRRLESERQYSYAAGFVDFQLDCLEHRRRKLLQFIRDTA